jgi:hypothetical protein
MPADPPIACTLGANDYRRRLDEVRALGDAALIDTESEPGRAVLRFAASAGIRARVDNIVAAEAECCSFLTMTVTDEPDVVVLTIEAPRDAALVLDELVGALAPFRQRPGHSVAQ